MVRVTRKSNALTVPSNDAALATPSFLVLGFDQHSSSDSRITGNETPRMPHAVPPILFCKAPSVGESTDRESLHAGWGCVPSLATTGRTWRPVRKKNVTHFQRSRQLLCTRVCDTWQLAWLPVVTNLYLIIVYTLPQMLLINNTQDNWYGLLCIYGRTSHSYTSLHACTPCTLHTHLNMQMLLIKKVMHCYAAYRGISHKLVFVCIYTLCTHYLFSILHHVPHYRDLTRLYNADSADVPHTRNRELSDTAAECVVPYPWLHQPCCLKTDIIQNHGS